MNTNLTDINIVLDRSGSMEYVRQATIDGLNSFVKDQKDFPGECNISLAQFATEYDMVWKGLPINKVPKMEFKDYVPRGMTALWEAIIKTINLTGERLAKLQEKDRPGKVLVAVMIDGGENASNVLEGYTLDKLKELIKRQTDLYNWTFVFIGANQDAVLAGTSMGFQSTNSVNYASTNIGTQSAFNAVSKSTTMYRSSIEPQAISFFDGKTEV